MKFSTDEAASIDCVGVGGRANDSPRPKTIVCDSVNLKVDKLYTVGCGIRVPLGTIAEVMKFTV